MKRGALAIALGAVALACSSPGAAPRRDLDPRLGPLGACAVVPAHELGALEVVVAIDASASTAEPSGGDVNEDGYVGEPRRRGAPELRGTSTDPGDSLLAVQVAAARALVAGVASPIRRFSVVAYSSPERGPGAGSPTVGNAASLDASFDAILEAGSGGGGQFSHGMNLAVESLLASAPRRDSPRRLVLFVSDGPEPSFRAASGERRRLDPAMRGAAEQALGASIAFHTLGIGEAAEAKLPHQLARIAGATGGRFRAVPDPSILHCAFFAALLPK